MTTNDAASRAMEESGDLIVQERLTNGERVHWHSWKDGKFWKFSAGRYLIVCWTEIRDDRRVRQYLIAHRQDVLNAAKAVGSLREAKRVVASHARAAFVERERAKVSK